MSKYSEIQNQYKGFVAAQEAVAKTNPGNVGVVYKKSDSFSEEGVFIYNPEKDRITIRPCRNDSSDYVDVNAEDIPDLIKALREFFEEKKV